MSPTVLASVGFAPSICGTDGPNFCFIGSLLDPYRSKSPICPLSIVARKTCFNVSPAVFRRKKVGDEMFISPRYLANIENKGQHPSLQIFFELIQRYHISVDQFLLETPPEKNTQRRQLDALLDGMSDTGIRIVTATAKEISEVEKEGE